MKKRWITWSSCSFKLRYVNYFYGFIFLRTHLYIYNTYILTKQNALYVIECSYWARMIYGCTHHWLTMESTWVSITTFCLGLREELTDLEHMNNPFNWALPVRSTLGTYHFLLMVLLFILIFLFIPFCLFFFIKVRVIKY